MTEPVSLETLKVHLRLDADDTSQDDYLDGLIVAARRACEAYTGRYVSDTQRSISLDRWPCLPVFLEADVASVDSVTYLDSTGTHTLDTSIYGVDLVSIPARFFRAAYQCWPLALCQPGAIKITYTVAACDDDILAVIAQAMLLTIANWFRNRETAVVGASGGAVELPMASRWLLDSVRQMAP